MQTWLYFSIDKNLVTEYTSHDSNLHGIVFMVYFYPAVCVSLHSTYSVWCLQQCIFHCHRWLFFKSNLCRIFVVTVSAVASDCNVCWDQIHLCLTFLSVSWSVDSQYVAEINSLQVSFVASETKFHLWQQFVMFFQRIVLFACASL